VKSQLEMKDLNKFMIFLCSSAAKAGTKKLSYRVAAHLEVMGIGNIATLQQLNQQHASVAEAQNNMIFINDCRSGCVNVLTHGFQKEKYVYIDVSPYLGITDFDITYFVHAEILPRLNKKWNFPISV
jgi:uncharacterized metal-binding protein